MDIAATGPYVDLVQYLKVHRTAVENALRTLSYVDAVNSSAWL
jgi:cephalosporin-C deacetylase